jgi:hypothetical protein
MIDKNIRFISPVGHGRDLDVPPDEPSHIHIARPSRMRRRDNPGSNVEPVNQVALEARVELAVLQAALATPTPSPESVRDLAATQIKVHAA